MLHIRVVTTPGLTGRLLDRLADLPGIRNLIVLEGAARPSGDAIFFDVDRSAANPVFRALRGLSLDHDGAVTVEQVDASLARTTGATTAIGSPASETPSVTACSPWPSFSAAIVLTFAFGVAVRAAGQAPAGTKQEARRCNCC